MISEIANVIRVVQSATQRALRFSASPSPRIAMMNSAPTSGRNVVTERIGQLMVQLTRPPNMNQVISAATPISIAKALTGLQTGRAARPTAHARRDAVGSPAIDHPGVAILRQDAAEPERRAHDEGVVDLVEIPLVEQEPVERLVLARELGRQLRP